MRLLALALVLAGSACAVVGALLAFGAAASLILGGLMVAASGLLLIDVTPKESRGKPPS